MNDILIMATIIAPVTSGVVQAIKSATSIKKRYIPVIATIVGVGLGAAAYFIEVEIGLRIWAGGISGLAATGLFELGKNTVNNGE